MPELYNEDIDDDFEEEQEYDSDDDEPPPALMCLDCGRIVANKSCNCDAPLTRNANSCRSIDFVTLDKDDDPDADQNFGNLVNDDLVKDSSIQVISSK